MEKISVMKLAVSQLVLLNKSALVIPLRPFVCLCNCLLHVLDKIGPTMGVLSQEIRQNIQRFEDDDGGGSGTDLVHILKKEVDQGRAKTGGSCSRAFLWLTRSLDFTMALLEKIISNEPAGMNMEQAVEEAYHRTLKPCHGWISSAAYKIALKLVPDRDSLMNILMENEDKYETLLEDIQSFIPLLSAFLQKPHSILRLYNLDRIKSK